jgi:excisionase family DNA binding protein
MANSQSPRRLLSVSEACHLLSVSRPTLYRLIGSGRIETVTIGTARRVKAESLDQLVDTGAETSAA